MHILYNIIPAEILRFKDSTLSDISIVTFFVAKSFEVFITADVLDAIVFAAISEIIKKTSV